MLRHRFNWKRVSAAATLCYRSDRKRARLYFHTHPGAYNNESLIEFILELRCHFRGDKVPSSGTDFPPSVAATWPEFLGTQRHWLVVERLPAYAPELNPVEGLWSNLKGTELANPAIRPSMPPFAPPPPASNASKASSNCCSLSFARPD